MKSRAMKRYLVIVEEGPNNCSAYSPDVPGCIATGATREETISNMRDAIAFHLDGLRQEGEPVPDGRAEEVLTVSAAHVDVA